MSCHGWLQVLGSSGLAPLAEQAEADIEAGLPLIDRTGGSGSLDNAQQQQQQPQQQSQHREAPEPAKQSAGAEEFSSFPNCEH